MSATLDTQLFLNYFGGVPLHIPGRQHHVTVLYAREPQPDIMDSAMITVLQVCWHGAQAMVTVSPLTNAPQPIGAPVVP